jgi:tyrosine-protein phosphatase SIW14
MIRLLFVLMLSAMLMLGLMANAEEAAPAPETPQTSTSQKLLTPRNDVPGVKNFARISDDLYRGEQPTVEGFTELKKMGVKTIVNLRSFHSDRALMTGTGLQYLHLYCKAWHPEEEDVAQFLKLLKDPNNRPVFVHCQHGADRTGMMVASYRMLEQGWNSDDAAKETHNFGFHKMFAEIQTYLQRFSAAEMAKILNDTATPKLEVVK